MIELFVLLSIVTGPYELSHNEDGEVNGLSWPGRIVDIGDIEVLSYHETWAECGEALEKYKAENKKNVRAAASRAYSGQQGVWPAREIEEIGCRKD